MTTYEHHSCNDSRHNNNNDNNNMHNSFTDTVLVGTTCDNNIAHTRNGLPTSSISLSGEQAVCASSNAPVAIGGYKLDGAHDLTDSVPGIRLSSSADTIDQVKLSKSEWDYTEIPESHSEKDIMQMIISGFGDVNIIRTSQHSLLSFLKIAPTPEMHQHLYTTFYQALLESLVKKHRKNERDWLTRTAATAGNSGPIVDVFQSWERIMGDSKAIKKIDAMRIQNIKMDTSAMDGIYENILLSVFDKLMQEKYPTSSLKWTYYYYTLCKLYANNIPHLNANVDSFISHVIRRYENEAIEHANVLHFIKHAYDYIERNEYIHRYASMQLYEHQKELFTVIKTPGPKLVLYIAPTGTGKTLSPLGITEKFKVVFICAARHVGIALAKAAITMKKKVAFAFGCNNIDDIRLHYFSAKEYTRDWKTGGIRKVDNSVGDNVELMICDVKSYLYAMHYMCAFNCADRLVMYWDEPTIMLDYTDHPYHSIIHRTWSKNVIPNIVLSSATLPKENEIGSVLSDFRTKFSGLVHDDGNGVCTSPQVYNIVSHDCKKSIPILNKSGLIELPHFLFASDYNKVKESATHCETYKTIMRYFDLREIVKFIGAVDTAGSSVLSSQRYQLVRYFSDKLTDITMITLKEYYLKLLAHIRPDAWNGIMLALNERRTPVYPSTIYMTTQDAYTLTDGPTIYLTSEVKKIAAFALQHTEIPDEVFNDIMNDIEFNAVLSDRIADLERQLDDERAKREGSGNGTSGAGASNEKGGRSVSKKELDSKMCINEKSAKVMKRYDELFSLQGKINELRDQVKTVTLNEIFIPNTDEHYQYWSNRNDKQSKKSLGDATGSRFSSDVDTDTVEQIMLLPIENSWKLLLLMGIGVITNPHDIDGAGAGAGTQYNDIIKTLAQNQKLYLIIASSDYIYGTNYQFCHGYIGKDLSGMTQEKTVQAMGRVGRNSLQQNYTIRFRDDGLIKKIFTSVSSNDKLEVINMNRLFTSGCESDE